jgi:glycosyltransferase involved in cell wall biosynthesis
VRIGFITPEYVTESNFDGGLANYLHRVALALTRRGHDIEIFTSSNINERTLDDGIIVNRVKHDYFLNKLLKKIAKKRLNTIIDILFRSYFLKKRFLKVHRQKMFDIIQVSSFWAPGLFLTKADVPIVTRISSFEPLWRSACGCPCYFNNALAEWVEIVQMRRSAAVYAPSKLLADLIPRYEPIDVDVVYPPFLPPPEENWDDSVYVSNLNKMDYLLFFGTICKMKGIEFIWRNLLKILTQNPKIHFVFIGKGNLPQFTEDLEPLRDRIKHLKALPHPQLFPIIKNARSIVLPSMIDNLPNACLESMFFGKAVVGTNGASFDEIIENGESGFLIKYSDDDGFCSLIHKICQASDFELDRIGSNARKAVLLKLEAQNRVEDLELYFEKIRIGKS